MSPVWIATDAGVFWDHALPYSTFPTNGSYTLLSRATDTAGNVETPSAGRTFTVTFVSGGIYIFEGFFSPIDNPPIVNKANAGSTIPVKWRITLNGVPVSDPNSFAALTSSTANCGTMADLPGDDIETYTTNSGLQYNNNGNWHFNWKTPKTYAKRAGS